MRKYFAEFIGTFFLVLTVGCTVIPAAAGVIPALAIGAVLMVMIFAGGHISGGHFNPAVTFAIFIRGRLELKDVVPYWLAQIAAEFRVTSTHAYVVVNFATAIGTWGSRFYGLAIGFTVPASTCAVGAIAG